jgi:hypothetical protein
MTPPDEYVSEYQRVVDDIANDRLKDKSPADLKQMRLVLISQHETDKFYSGAQPYISIVEGEIAGRKSNRLVWWTILVAIVATVFSAIAAWPVMREWIPASQGASQSGDTDSSSGNKGSTNLSTAPPLK